MPTAPTVGAEPIALSFLYRPPRRFDGKAWVEFRVEAAGEEDGGWIPLGEPVPIPTYETPFTGGTTITTLVVGPWFRLVYVDAAGVESVGPSFTIPAGVAVRPSLDDVAALLHARTYAETGDILGEALGSFTESTHPSAAQVEVLIDHAAADMAVRAGTEVPPALYETARDLIAMRAAMLVEMSYFPEQSEGGRTVYQSLRLTYEEGAKRLARAAEAELFATEGLL